MYSPEKKLGYKNVGKYMSFSTPAYIGTSQETLVAKNLHANSKQIRRYGDFIQFLWCEGDGHLQALFLQCELRLCWVECKRIVVEHQIPRCGSTIRTWTTRIENHHPLLNLEHKFKYVRIYYSTSSFEVLS